MTRGVRTFMALLCLAATVALGEPWVTASPVAAPAIGPLRIVLLVDSSGAVATMLNSFRAGLAAFLDALPGDPEITFITTGGQLRIRVPPTHDRERLKKAAAGFASDGGANAFVDSLLESDQRFLKKAPELRPVLVMITTDNNESRGEPRIDDYNKFMNDFMRRNGRAHGVVIHGVNQGVTTDIVMNLTTNTGGSYHSLAIANSLPERMKMVAAMVAADMP